MNVNWDTLFFFSFPACSVCNTFCMWSVLKLCELSTSLTWPSRQINFSSYDVTRTKSARQPNPVLSRSLPCVNNLFSSLSFFSQRKVLHMLYVVDVVLYYAIVLQCMHGEWLQHILLQLMHVISSLKQSNNIVNTALRPDQICKVVDVQKNKKVKYIHSILIEKATGLELVH